MRDAHADRFEIVEDCGKCPWSRPRFFCSFSRREDLESWSESSDPNYVDAGSTVYLEGQRYRGAYVLCAGRIKMTRTAGDRKHIVRIVEPGDVIGLAEATGAVSRYRSSAQAIDPSQVRFVPRGWFLDFMRSHEDICERAMRQLSDQCESLEEMRIVAGEPSVRRALARLLLFTAARSGRATAEGVRVRPMLSQKEIAQVIGTSRETITRLLKWFREKDLIEVRGAAILIRNIEALGAVANGVAARDSSS